MAMYLAFWQTDVFKENFDYVFMWLCQYSLSILNLKKKYFIIRT